MGYDIGRTTVQRILAEHGIEPAPQRKREYSWATFIKAHLGAIAGMDFFTVEVLTVVGLVRYHVLFVIDIGSRIVEVVGLARDPGGEWMKQMARNLLDADDGFLRGKRYLILDRDPLYTKEFRQMLRGAGVKPLLLPARSPNLNAYAERFVLSIKSECLDRIVPLGEGHLRRAIGEYLVHYHGERNHQGLANVLLKGAPTPANANGSGASTRTSRWPAELLPPRRGLIGLDRILGHDGITYPTLPAVVYTYGASTETGDAHGNVAGRIKQVTMEAGSETRTYDHFGNVNKTVTTLNNMSSTTPPTIAFTMKYTYDWLGRMQTMTFPNWIDQSFNILAG